MNNINYILVGMLLSLIVILIIMIMFIHQLDEINNKVAIIADQLQIDIINLEYYE